MKTKEYKRIGIETENKNYVRDLHSKALLAINRSAADDYKTKKKMLQTNRELQDKVDELTEKVNRMEEILTRIEK